MVGSTHNELPTPTLIINQESGPQTFPQANLMEAISSAEVLSSLATLACAKLTNTN